MFPFAKRSRLLAKVIGDKLGQFLDFDELDISGWAKYMRIRVRMKVDKPLPRGTAMKLGRARLWVDMRIERVPGFCYACGCLGHVLRECNDYDEEVPKSDLPYGAWLRASPMKMRGKGNNPEKEVKNKLFLDLQEGAKRKLKFSL
ncbi:Gag-Pro-Pol polyprotein [Bienertia sinuspersici]